MLVNELCELTDSYCQTQQTIYYKNIQFLHNYTTSLGYTKN